MKKILPFTLLALSAAVLAGCGETPSSPLVVSKLFTATSQRNNVIELYNPSAEAIELGDFSFRFYTNGADEMTAEIKLTGMVEAESYFAVGSSNNSLPAVLSALDFSYAEGSLPFNGNDAIELIYKDTVIDFLGRKGMDVDYSKNVTMIRLGEKEDYTPSATFDAFNFISYIPDYFESLKNDNHVIKTLDQLYAGPVLEDRYKSMPFVQEGSTTIGGGGAVQTTLNSAYDGDTAAFRATTTFGGGSVRYYYINTPEVHSPYVNAEPWGYVASKYNKEYILNNASSKTIYIQSIPGGALEEVNGRTLGLVWVNGVLSQYLTVREGLSEDVGVSFSAIDIALTYEDVPYLTFLQFNEHRAVLNGWGTKGYPTNPEGDKSPDWNYSANNGVGANSTTTPVWQPHLAMPW